MKRFFCVIIVLSLLLSSANAEGSIIEDIIPDLSTDTLIYLRDKINDEIKKRNTEKPENEYGMWKIKYYVDEFKEPTDDSYIVNKEVIFGKYATSAITSQTVTAYIFFDYSDDKTPIFWIKLFDQGVYSVTNALDTEYIITIKDISGKAKQIWGMMFSNSSSIRILEDGNKTLFDMLSKENEISFSIRENNAYSRYGIYTNYIFTVKNPSGFVNACKAILAEGKK